MTLATRDLDGDRYLSLPDLESYSGISKRQLRSYLVTPPLPRDASAPLPPPLPHYRLGRRIVVRAKWTSDRCR